MSKPHLRRKSNSKGQLQAVIALKRDVHNTSKQTTLNKPHNFLVSPDMLHFMCEDILLRVFLKKNFTISNDMRKEQKRYNFTLRIKKNLPYVNMYLRVNIPHHLD